MKSRELIFIKPDAIERKLVGKVIDRFEQAGFSFQKMQEGRISMELALELYPDSREQVEGMGKKTHESMTKKGETHRIKEIFGTEDPVEIGKQLNQWNRKYATSTDVIAAIVENEDAAQKARDLIGKTDPSLAAKGTIRGDWGADSIYMGNVEKRACKNLVHASDVDRAQIDVDLFNKHFFSKK